MFSAGNDMGVYMPSVYANDTRHGSCECGACAAMRVAKMAHMAQEWV